MPAGSGGLVDRHGRVATDLRVSLTDRCNLRCTYCMPPEGLDWLPKVEVLTDEEIVRLVRIGVEQLGIREVRFTGGEPLLRPGLVGIVAAATALRPRPGGQPDHQRDRAGPGRPGAGRGRAGPDQRQPRHPRPGAVQAAHPPRPAGRRARRAGRRAGRRADAGEGQRGPAARHQRGRRRPAARLLPGARLPAAVHRADAAGRPPRLDPRRDGHRRGHPRAARPRRTRSRPTPRSAASAPAERWLVDGGPATVGVIASVTRSFCGACDRTRLTADGQIRNCLFAREESDLRTAMREGATDEELADRWRIATLSKLPGPRHRRPELPAADPADVGDRRLTVTRHRAVLRRRPGRRPASTPRPARRGTLDELVGQIVDAHGERLERVLTACSFLVDGTTHPGPGVGAVTRGGGRRPAALCRRLSRRMRMAHEHLRQGEGQGRGAARPRRAGLRRVPRRRRGDGGRRGPRAGGRGRGGGAEREEHRRDDDGLAGAR